MATDDKAKHKADEFKAKTKEKLGHVTGNEQWQAEGKVEQTTSNVKQAGDKLKDAMPGKHDKK